MTLEEAKNKLKKEGFVLNKIGKRLLPEKAFIEDEDPDVCEAMQIIESAGFGIGMELNHFDERKARLKEEREKHSNAPMPTPGSSENRIKEDSGVNPALKESASQFNDALLDEQAKKIKELTEENENWKSWHEMQNRQIALSNIAFRNEKNRLGKEIARLNKVIYKKNLKIEELKKESSEHLDGKVKYYGETVDLSQELCDKNEELRLSKIREKNLTEVCQKYMKENEELNEKAKSVNMHRHKELAEKDEVIADLGNELAATKKELEEKTKLVEVVRKGSKEYCEYGIAAEKMIRKMANVIVYEGKVSSKEFEEYRRWANGYRFNPQLYDFIEEEEKKLNAAKMVDINAMCMRAARESINDVFESYAAKYAKSSLDDLKDNAYELFNAKAHNLGLVGSKDGNGIIDQMVGADFAEEGGDQSASIVVQCGNGITLSKEEAEIIERCTKNGTELHYSEKDGFTYTNMYGEEIPIICLRGMFHVFTDEEIKNMKRKPWQ